MFGKNEIIQRHHSVSERQSFARWWLWLITLSIHALLLFALYGQPVIGKPIGTNPATDTALILITVFVILNHHLPQVNSLRNRRT